MKKYDWKNEYNPIRRTAKRLLSGEALTDGRPLSDLIELDEHTRKCLAFEATLTDRQIDMLQELGYLPVIMRQYGEECANCPYTLDGLILNMATRIKVNLGGKSITTVDAALKVLTNTGVINSPDYWATAYSSLAWLDTLLISAANALTAD